CSDSACLTRGSFAPWAISSGVLMLAARESGDRDHRNSASVAGFPTRWWNSAICGCQYGGEVSLRVLWVEGATKTPPHLVKTWVHVNPRSTPETAPGNP